MTTVVLIDSNIPNLKLLSKGKVRDIYATSSPEYLLFVASDRISAYDVILKNVNSSLPFPLLTHILLLLLDDDDRSPRRD
jgi:SAICAR synthetase